MAASALILSPAYAKARGYGAPSYGTPVRPGRADVLFWFLMHRVATIVLVAAALLAASAADMIVTKISLADETAGKESQAFLSMVGNWIVVADGDRKVIMADGRPWKRGQPAGGLADKARQIYGSRNEEFIDNVQAFAYFPYAIAQQIPEFQNGEISMRFKLIEGQLDQCAGILFNLKPNGDYLTVRFNGKEDNLVLWTFKNGKRTFTKKAKEDVPLELKKWYTMKIAVHGTELKGYLNGNLILEYTLAEPVKGRVGLWSKTDSVAYFDDYSVTTTR